MEPSRSPGKANRQRSSSQSPEISLEHYARVLWHRKWIVLICFVVVSAGTAAWSSRLKDVYTSETVILVDPQKVPTEYVRSTVTGDVRNRLGTLSQQILSATRLQKIIDSLNLYADERKSMAREDVIARMRNDISVGIVSDFGGGQDLQAFRIGFSGRDPRLVAQVANELASLFIEENLKAREQSATGTAEFLRNQLDDRRKMLTEQEAKLSAFKLKHMGEMPEQQAANLQILGQLQSQLQLESESLSRSEQQKAYLQSLATSTAPVVDLDAADPPAQRSAQQPQQAASRSQADVLRARLENAMQRYTEDHPEVRRLKRQLDDELARQAKQAPAPVVAAADPPPPIVAPPVRRSPVRTANPILESQIRGLDEEIARHKQERERLSKLVSQYQGKLEAIPLREQQISEVVRDYEISKAHYKQLLEKQLSADTATELEIRQKGERFTVLDAAQPAQRPSRPNRMLINAAGAVVGFGLGLLLALVTELFGMSIASPEQIVALTGLTVLEVIPVIHTRADHLRRRRLRLIGMVSGAFAGAASCALLLYHYRYTFF